MDLKIKEEIQFEALSVYSTNLVKARSNLQYIRSKIDDPTTDINESAKLKLTIEALIRNYDSVRIQQARIKHTTLNLIYKKYPMISSSEIRCVLEAAVNEYETVSTDYMEFDNNGLVKEEAISITIPLYANPNKYDIAVLRYIRNKLNNPNITMNETVVLHKELESTIRRYNSLRSQQTLDRHNELSAIYTKYPAIDTYEIRGVLDSILKKYDKYNIMDISTNEKVEIPIPLYAKPIRKDMAVILVYFNPCEYKKLAQNLTLTYQNLVRSNIPVFLVEHCFKDQAPLFKKNETNIFNTRSNSYMFYKENLINWLMPKIPEQYTKFFMMDCDLLFEKDTWYDDVSGLLDTHDIVQPFQTAIWLDSDLKSINLKKDSFAYIASKNEKISLDKHDSGFAWAARRDFIQPIGLFDLYILGSGDVIFAFSALQNKYNWNITVNSLVKYHNEYYKLFNGVKTTYYPQNIYHLWHGSAYNRGKNTRYNDFNKLCKDNNLEKKEDIFYVNSQGIYEFNETTSKELNEIILNYFKSRNEDGI